MAKYDVRFSCGHTQEKALFGKHESRQNYIDWANKNGVCTACATADEAAGITAIEHEMGLATLQGSVKQIAWARKIRAKLIRSVQERVAGLAQRVTPEKETVFAEEREIIFAALAARASAGGWIDDRDAQIDTLIKRAVKK